MKLPPVSLSGIHRAGPLRCCSRVAPVSLKLYSSGIHVKRALSSHKQTRLGHYQLQPRPFISTSTGARHHSHHHSIHSSSASSKDKMTCISLILTPELLLSVREFWFEHLSGPDSLVMPTTDENKRWFFGGSEFDKLCVERFAPTLEQLRRDGIKSGQDIIYALQPNDSHDWLSLILLLDQIPRNCYRGDNADIVFNYFDPMAREVALTAIQRGIPEKFPEVRWRFAYRSWFYVPLMHSEDISLHDLAVEKYEGLKHDVESLLPSEMDVEWNNESEVAHEYHVAAQRVVQSSEEAAREYAQLNLGFEKRHWAIIKRFGRYPHRNRVMGREPTDEEREYLENGGDTFGG